MSRADGGARADGAHGGGTAEVTGTRRVREHRDDDELYGLRHVPGTSTELEERLEADVAPYEQAPPLVDEPGPFLVVMPTYNEAENIFRIVPRVLAQDARIHVLVVDDNSPDRTGDLVAAMAADEERLHLLRRAGKEGLGKAYLGGFRWGLERDFELFCEMDADFSHHPDNLPAFIEQMAEYDVVMGSRYVGGRVTVVNWPMSRLLISFFGSFYARMITGMPIRDATGGFNCFRRAVLEEIDLSRIQSNGYAFQIELKFRAWKKGFRMRELPIVFAERESGESKMSKRILLEAVWRVWWLRIQDLLGIL